MSDKVTIYQNIIAPYRKPLFENLGESVDLTVYYSKSNNKDRNWNTSNKGQGYTSEVLNYIEIGPFIINYSLLKTVWKDDTDVIIATDTLQTVFTTVFLALYCSLGQTKFILWSEVFEDDHKFKRLPSMIHSIKNHRLRWVGLVFFKLFITVYRAVLYKCTNKYLAFSEDAKEYLQSNNVAESQIYVVNQVMPKDQIPKSKTKMEKPEEVVILYLGYLRSVKGVDILVKAFRMIDSDNIKLLIAGDGDQRDNLESLASDDERISFLGYVDECEKGGLYSNADIFVLPTFHDPWGLVVNEAVEFGLPIILTKSAACRQTLIQNNGLIIPTDDVHSLKSSIKLLASNSAVRDQMSSESKKVASKYNQLEQEVEPFIQAIES
ncbi:glycosyltransferase family 4 protein [Haloferax volcanii]|uniref:Glycosyltransferase family 4 protein n=1 Tax=Haloferax volcanii TaxID=2246 RepID=A0A558G9H7_HALVO|nr:glycosyltransferase family 4 protein [Haloferax volcanii]TVT94418.1 glycosyltransferase family 4 protein [Haloferax volcanii]